LNNFSEHLSSSKNAALFSVHRLGGVLIPFTTPFTAEERIDHGAIRSNIEKWNRTGIIGYVALGSTGERVHLSERECLDVLETARREVPTSMAFIVGAGQQGTRETIREIKLFADTGADAALVITPHFYRRAMTPDALISFYSTVAEASPVPIILYNMPDNTGIALAADTVAKLSEHQNIIGLKDSSSDIVNFAEIVRLVPNDFAVMAGNGNLVFATMSAGANGAILAVACVAAQAAVSIVRAVENSEFEIARDLQRRLAPLARAVTSRFGIGGLKSAMELLGYSGGFVRAPLSNASEVTRTEIASLIDECGLFQADESLAESECMTGAIAK
jgi:4-hydroxy-2-oxoglutarate aldolase